MKIDFASMLNDHDGKAMTFQGKPTTLGFMVRVALDSEYPGQQASGAEKFRRWQLAEKTMKPETDYTVDELKTMMDCLAMAFPPAVVGPAFTILDPALAAKP